MKTKLLLSVFLLFFSVIVNAQDWAKPLKGKKNLTFYEIQNAFDSYYQTHQKEDVEDGPYAKYKRWEHYWEPRVDSAGHFPSPMIAWNAWKKYQTDHLNPTRNSSLQNTGNWSPLGPSTVPVPAYSGMNEPGMGRVNCIAFHPTDPNTFWVGAPAGGLWKTTDGGTTWTPLTDNLPVIGVSDIVVDYNNPNIIYIASGDAEHPPFSLDAWKASTNSIGILKTTDGGTTWNTTGLSFNVSSAKYISKIIINPSNPNILLAAASDGVYKTINGGTTWTNTYPEKYFTDIVFKPGNPNRVYAAEYNESGNAGIYISTDGGSTWPMVNHPSSNAMRIKLGVTALNGQYVDALIASVNDDGWLQGMYSSSDSAMNFSFVYGTYPTDYNLLANDCSGSWSAFTNGSGSQGWYDLVYMIDPNTITTSWAGGINIWKSTNSGSAWSINTIWNGNLCSASPVHGDHHCLTYNPLNNYIYDCNDGGLFRTTDDGATWTNLSNGLQISQMFRLGENAANGNDVICGFQDNGTNELYNGTWYQTLGGDGMECMIDPTNGNIEYASHFGGDINQTTDGFSTQPTVITPSTATGGAWVTPYVMQTGNSNVLYASYDDVWQSNDQGATWTNISSAYSPLTGSTATPLQSLAVAPSDPNYIYTGAYHTLYMTNDGGTTWYNATTNLPLTNSSISYIAIKQNDPLTVWVTLSGYVSGDKVFKTTNGGASWVNISGTLPNIPFNCIVYQNGSNDGLYIGGDVGVYYRDNTMNDWMLFNSGLPNAPVYELGIHYGTQKLRAATFGRGLWESDLYSVSTGVQNTPLPETAFSVYPNPTNGIINIQSYVGSDYSVDIYTPVGKKVFELQNISTSKTKINLPNLSNGIYFVQIQTKPGIVTKKIIIAK